MFQDLLEKIDYEYEKFRLEMMRTSKENVFASSQEIEMKKELKNILSGLTFSEEEKEALLLTENLLESMYSLMEECRPQRAEEIRSLIRKKTEREKLSCQKRKDREHRKLSQV